MTRNSRELSQFASFVEVRDANQNIGITTSLVMLGGVGIGSTVGDYLAEKTARGSVDPLINFNESYLLDDVYIEGQLNVDGGTSGSITGAGATFPALNVGGLTTTRNLIVTGVTTLSRDSGMGTVYVGQKNVPVASSKGSTPALSNADIGIAVTGPGGASYADDDETVHGLVVIDNVGSADPKEVALYVSGRVHFNGGDPLITDPINGGETGLKTEFVVVPESLFYDKVSVLEGIDIVDQAGVSVGARLRVFNSQYAADPGFAVTTPAYNASIWTSGGIEAKQYGRIGAGLSVNEYIDVGRGLSSARYAPDGTLAITKFLGDLEIRTPSVIVGIDSGDQRYFDAPNNRTHIDLQTSTLTTLYPYISGVVDEPAPGIGSDSGRWGAGYFSFLDVGPGGTTGQINCQNLDVGVGATIGFLNVSGVGGTDANEVYLNVGPGKAKFAYVDSAGLFYHSGIATVQGFLNVLSDGFNNAFVATAFQANNVDLYKQDETNSTSPEFFYPAMANAGTAQTAAGGQLFVNPGFYLDAFSTSLFVHNNLNVLGTAINASEESPDLRFDLLNYGVTELNIASGAARIDIGQAEEAGSITSIRSELTELVRLRLSQNDIQASTGATNITLNDNVNTQFAGWVQIGGTYIKVDSNTINIADTSQRADLFKSAEDIVIGADDLGIATIRNNVTDLTGFLKLGKNAIRASDGTTAIQIGAAATYTEITGDLVVGGKDIQDGIGITNITLVGDTKTIFYGDIEVRGNEILSSDGSVNILMLDGQELTSFTGPIRVEGNQIQAGTGDTNITLQSNQNTIFAGAIEIDGDEIRASNGQPNILMDSDLLTTVTGDLKVGTGTVRAGDGTICIAMEGGTGSVAISSDVSANSAFFNGIEARLNVQDVDIRDNLLTIGLIEDPTTQGTLIPPNVGVGNSGDVGIVMARYDVGLATHKYAAIYYDNSEGRVAIRTDVQDAGLGVGRDRYLLSSGLPSELEVQNLYVNINNTLGIKTIFEANTVDDGENITEVLNVVNIEIDAGVYA